MKRQSLALLLVAQIAALSLWFISAAILPQIASEFDISTFRQAALSSGVQAGFVIGALLSAILGLSDKYDPRRVFTVCILAAGLINLTMLIAEPGGNLTIGARFLTGALLAGVYPVGMKIAVSWGEKDRAFLVGSLVGALTLGSALPHLFALWGGANWRISIMATSVSAIFAGFLCLAVKLGPFYKKAKSFNPSVIFEAWTNPRIRFAYLGYLGHMWELYAMWAWLAVFAAASYSASMPIVEAQRTATLTAFMAIASGGFACVAAGWVADRLGKAETAILCMAASGTAAVLSATFFGGPVWLSFTIFIAWGLTIVPDSALFSALVADAAPPENSGSLMTFQTALGFALTFFTVQITPVAAVYLGWPWVLAALALGPAIGIYAMLKLRKIGA